MSPAREAGPARRYHQDTSHDRWNLSGHALDWGNQPRVFKTYDARLNLSTHPLPEPAGYPGMNLREAREATATAAHLDEPALSRALHLCYGITALSRHRSGDFHYRSAPSAGALYPAELYLALGAPLDLETRETGPCLGLHHYDPRKHRLESLGRQRALHDIALACGLSPSASPTAAFVVSAIFFRSSWKYRARAYRYCLLDTGHLLENLLLALRAEGLAASLHYDFTDTALNTLLGLDSALEAALAVVFVHAQEAEAPPSLETPFPEAEATLLEAASRVAAQEQHYQAIAAVHQAGSLEAADSGCGRGLRLSWEDVTDQPQEYQPLSQEGVPDRELEPLPAAVLSRRSKRNFVPEALKPQQATTLVRLLCDHGAPGLRADGPRAPLLTAFAAGKAGGEPLADGLYLLDQGRCRVARRHAGSVHEALAHVCLGQEWLKNANLHFLFCTDLARLEEACGPRGYRYALLEAGRHGERVYLAASSLGLGACGVGAFFDQEAAMLLGVEHKAQLLYAVAAGKVRK